MAISGAVESVRPSDPAGTKRAERRALGVACGAHILHDGYTDLVWVALPIWQTEFRLNYAAAGLLRTIYSGTLAGLQIPATALAGHIGAGRAARHHGQRRAKQLFCVPAVPADRKGGGWRLSRPLDSL